MHAASCARALSRTLIERTKRKGRNLDRACEKTHQQRQWQLARFWSEKKMRTCN